jgi:hypothetical protein
LRSTTTKYKYHVKKWNTTHITAKQLCHHINSGLTPKNLTRVNPEDKDTPILTIPYKVE